MRRFTSGVNFGRKLEAPPGFEPGVEVLQTSALPLGDGADRTCELERHGLKTVPYTRSLKTVPYN